MTTHLFKCRVYYQDTDAGGVVYHANYLHFAERARTEMLRDMGFDRLAMSQDFGIIFAVRAMNLDFKAPAKLDDLLEVETSLNELKGASMSLQQKISRANDKTYLAGADVVLVCLDEQFKAVRIPDPLRAAMMHFHKIAV